MLSFVGYICFTLEFTYIICIKDWLPKDVEQPIRIIAIDYPSTIFRFRNKSNVISTKGRSKQFQNELKEAGVGKRPIVFICHSMGGLILKQILTGSFY